MRIKVKYCGYCRANGSFNTVTVDTERNEYTDNMHAECDVFVEAHMSRDVNALRRECELAGMRKVG